MAQYHHHQYPTTTITMGIQSGGQWNHHGVQWDHPIKLVVNGGGHWDHQIGGEWIKLAVTGTIKKWCEWDHHSGCEWDQHGGQMGHQFGGEWDHQSVVNYFKLVVKAFGSGGSIPSAVFW